MARVFISYRRDETGGYTQAIFDDLTDRFGRGCVFKDHVTIPVGADFMVTIRRAIEHSDALVAVIGPTWASRRDASGRRRLDDAEDPVQFEIAAALERGIPVFPVLVSQAEMPRPADLPEAIRSLARLNAIELSDARWSYDIDRLAHAIEPSLPRAVLWRNRMLRRRWALALLISTFVATWSSISYLALPAPSRAPVGPTVVVEPMSGALNIAVADFGRLDDQDRTVPWEWATRLARAVHKDLDDHLGPLAAHDRLGIQTRGPDATGQIGGETHRERQRQAAAVARRIGADIVVYGNLRAVDGRTQFVPGFWLSPRILEDAEELDGHYEFGSRVEVTGDVERNVATFNGLLTQVSARSEGLAQFVVGLHFLSADRLADAARYIAAAEASRGWEEVRGQEVFQLFLGHVAGQAGNLDAAEAHYRRAIDANPTYPRARLGLAEVRFQRARGTCEQGQIDEPGLREALVGFQSALDVADGSKVPNLPSKVAWFKGRVHLCLSQALAGDYWDDAGRAFRQVIDEYRGGNEDVRELAADSHAMLAIVLWPSEGDADAEAGYRTAADELAEAARLTARDRRRGEYQGRAGLALERSGQYDRADEAYATALRLDPDMARQATYRDARERLRKLRGVA